jgi:hypothetical protein
MFTAVSGPDRRQLGFREAVKSSFAFVKRYGLKIVQEEVTLVRYQSDQVIFKFTTVGVLTNLESSSKGRVFRGRSSVFMMC